MKWLYHKQGRPVETWEVKNLSKNDKFSWLTGLSTTEQATSKFLNLAVLSTAAKGSV